MSGLVALFAAVYLFVDIGIIFSAYICSRFVFNGYLKKYHRAKWEDLVYTDKYNSLNLLSFDKTTLISEFRTDSTDDLGDPRIRKIRRISILLFNIGMWGWLALVVAFLGGAILFRLFGVM